MHSPSSRTFIAYIRVSTERQGHSGLGLEAQEAAINAFLRPADRLLKPPYVEIESGRKADRPELAKALARCRATGATLLIAKLDRLARDAHFLLGLQKAGVDFIACDIPDANRLTIGILALVAEEEAKAISARTKAALAAAKERRKKNNRLKPLGGIRRGQRPPTVEEARQGAAASAQKRSLKADHAAHRVMPRVDELRSSGASLGEIARTLQAEGVPTPRGKGGAWTATAVRRAILRAEAEAGAGAA